jgi:hypothetical protein
MITAKCRQLCIALLAVSCAPALVRADLVWEYLSTNGFTTVSGLMTTTGTPGQELIPGTTFTLKSFDTVFVNLVDLTAPSNWSSNNGPPFTSSPQGVIEVTVPGVAVIEATSVPLYAANGVNGVHLGRPPGGTGGDTFVVYTPTGGTHALFSPTVTTFTVAIPEPSSFLCVGLVGCLIYAGSFGIKKLRQADEADAAERK